MFSENVRKVTKLPSLITTVSRCLSVESKNEYRIQDSCADDKIFLSYHLRNRSSANESSCFDEEISLLCQQILNEQSALKTKINEQERLLKEICRRKPPANPFKQFSFINRENFNSALEKGAESAKAAKKFKFPRDVFTRKTRSRQSQV